VIVSIPAVRGARKQLVLSILGVLCAMLFAKSAHADTVRVIVDRALIWNRPDGVSIVLSQVTKGTVLQVQRRVGDWFEVVLPAGSARDNRDFGYIRASQVVFEPGGVLPDAPPSGLPPREPTPVAPTPSPAQRPRPGSRSSKTTFINIDGAYRQGSAALTQSVPAFSADYAEEGAIATDYGRGTGLQLDLMGGQTVWRHIGVGVGFSYYQKQTPAQVTASVPHPFYFNQARQASFNTQDLKREEIGVYFPVLWMPNSRGPFKVMVFGAPAFYWTELQAVSDVSLSEAYPFDTVAITGVTTTTKTGTSFGYNVGVDIAYMIGRKVGVGGAVHYSHAAISFNNDGNVTTNGNAGGLQFLFGLRSRF
jgi:hypothetical protein